MTSYYHQLTNKLDEKTAVVGIIGLGYVGLPLALCYAQAGYSVVGLDIDEAKISSLKEGKSYIQHIPDASIKQALNGKFSTSTDFGICSQLDAIILCVPTPLNRYREPDLSFIIETMKSVSAHLKPGQV